MAAAHWDQFRSAELRAVVMDEDDFPERNVFITVTPRLLTLYLSVTACAGCDTLTGPYRPHLIAALSLDRDGYVLTEYRATIDSAARHDNYDDAIRAATADLRAITTAEALAAFSPMTLDEIDSAMAG